MKKSAQTVFLLLPMLLLGCASWLIQEDGPIAMSNQAFLSETSVKINDRKGKRWYNGWEFFEGKYTEGRVCLLHRAVAFRPFSDTAKIQLDIVVNAEVDDILSVAIVNSDTDTVELDNPIYTAKVIDIADSILSSSILDTVSGTKLDTVFGTKFKFKSKGVFKIELTRAVVLPLPKKNAILGLQSAMSGLKIGQKYQVVVRMNGAAVSESRYEFVPVYRNNVVGVGIGLGIITYLLIFTPGSAIPIGS